MDAAVTTRVTYTHYNSKTGQNHNFDSKIEKKNCNKMKLKLFSIREKKIRNEIRKKQLSITVKKIIRKIVKNVDVMSSH